jgi:quercetin dioxygenase-like cupin family protein
MADNYDFFFVSVFSTVIGFTFVVINCRGVFNKNIITMESNEFEKSKVFNFSNSVEYAEGGIVSKTVLKKQTGNISLFSFAKGEALSEHTAPFDAMIQVVDGKGEVIIGGKSFLLETGQSIIMPANITHAVKAVEKFKMVLTMIKSS